MPVSIDLAPVRRALAPDRPGADDLTAACRAAAEALAVDGVGITVTLPDTLRLVVAASDELAELVEDAQLTVAEGPCTAATATGRPVTVPDLADPAETRWPLLARYLTDLPVHAVVAVPLVPGGLTRGSTLGSMDCVSSRAHGLDDLDLSVVGVLAGLMTDAVLRTAPAPPVPAGPFRDSWVDLHRATGMVIATLGLSPLDALDTLRARAFTDGRLLRELGTAITTGREPVVPPGTATRQT